MLPVEFFLFCYLRARISLYDVNVYQAVCVCASFSFGFDDGVWNSIVFVPDRCLSFFPL